MRKVVQDKPSWPPRREPRLLVSVYYELTTKGKIWYFLYWQFDNIYRLSSEAVTAMREKLKLINKETKPMHCNVMITEQETRIVVRDKAIKILVWLDNKEYLKKKLLIRAPTILWYLIVGILSWITSLGTLHSGFLPNRSVQAHPKLFFYHKNHI